MNIVQSTLTGETVDQERERPSTFMWCGETEQWVLRSMRADWPYELYEDQEAFVDSLNETEKEIDDIVSTDYEDEEKEVGGVYEITLSYSVDYTFTIPASNEDMAKERASDLKLDAHPSSSHQVHSQTRKTKTLYEDSDIVPDDYELYGSTPLWMAIEDHNNDE